MLPADFRFAFLGSVDLYAPRVFDTGGAIAGEVADYIGPLLESRGPAITAAFRSLFAAGCPLGWRE